MIYTNRRSIPTNYEQLSDYLVITSGRCQHSAADEEVVSEYTDLPAALWQSNRTHACACDMIVHASDT